MGTSARVLITSAAQDDLQQIVDFLSIEHPQIALSFVQDLQQRCIRLCGSTPRAGRLLLQREGFDLRQLIVGNYRLVYRHSDENGPIPNQVIILRVLHCARDLSGIVQQL